MTHKAQLRTAFTLLFLFALGIVLLELYDISARISMANAIFLSVVATAIYLCFLARSIYRELGSNPGCGAAIAPAGAADAAQAGGRVVGQGLPGARRHQQENPARMAGIRHSGRTGAPVHRMPALAAPCAPAAPMARSFSAQTQPMPPAPSRLAQLAGPPVEAADDWARADTAVRQFGRGA